MKRAKGRNTLVRRHLLLAALLLGAAVAAFPEDMGVYDDAVLAGWTNCSWGAYSLANASPVHSGTYSISCCTAPWDGLFFCGGSVSPASYDGLEFWVHGGTGSGQPIHVVFRLGSATAANAAVSTYLPGGPAAGTWQKVRIPFDAAGIGSSGFDGFWIWSEGSGTQPAIYVDDVVITEKAGGGGPVTVAVDPGADRRPIDPHIYGVSTDDLDLSGQPPYTVYRWGGNATTRYSWQADVSNRAMDWFFLNIAFSTNVSQLPDNSTADRWIDAVRARGAEPLLTVPLIGWTPADRTARWGFSIVKYGAQEDNECAASGYPTWCNEDAGNGVRPDGTTYVTGNDPLDTSVAIGPSFVTGWMAHIASRVGTAGNGGLKYFNLDNEPMLWNSTHRDVHPDPTSCAEIWQKTEQYAAAMKTQDPAALTLGPVLWGWCAYFYSALDGCSPGSDYAAYGPFLEWYMGRAEAYRLAHGVRLVDYMDVHYYPQAQDVALSDNESAAVAARRLRSVKSLYDPSYSDESWIGQAVNLIPRMKDIIARKAPGTKLAVTEYNWGNDTGLTSALAQAEVLAVFGREGVDLACRWVAPGTGTLVEDAFKLFLNYDGAGAKVEGDSVRATSSNVDEVGAYAVRRGDDRVYFLFVNKATEARTAEVTVAGSLTGNLSLYGFDATHRLQGFGSVTPASGSFSLELPARSARLAVGQFSCPLPAAVSDLRAQKVPGGASVALTWANGSGVTDYVVYEDSAPGGAFSTQAGTATSGVSGLTLPMPAGTRFYLAAARNACGAGPKK